jgi:glycosyltransferase involved in cell wall biosynthesis
MTLHDYLGMCNAQGQMRKTTGMLCQRATPLDCHGCFPERSPQDFFLRELFVKSFFKLVDHFICPSRFLRDRYVAWGLPAERMLVLENGQRPRFPEIASPAHEGVQRDTFVAGDASEQALHARFVVLGQLSELKGTRVLIEAVRAMPKHLRRVVRIEIYGTLQHAQPDFRQCIEDALEDLGPTLRYCGPYLPETVDAILGAADWLIVPSVWWENSPVVIQEAFGAGRPVICSNIGGMAEKVEDGVDGLHFMAGSATDLVRRIEEAAMKPGLWERLQGGVTRPPSVQETVARQLLLYQERAVDAPVQARSSIAAMAERLPGLRVVSAKL